MQVAAEVEMQKQHLDAAEVREDSVRTGGLDRAGVGRRWRRRRQSSICVRNLAVKAFPSGKLSREAFCEAFREDN